MLPHPFLEEALHIFLLSPSQEGGKPQRLAFLKYALVLESDQNLVYLLCSPLLGQVIQSTNDFICKSGHAAAVEEFLSE